MSEGARPNESAEPLSNLKQFIMFDWSLFVLFSAARLAVCRVTQLNQYFRDDARVDAVFHLPRWLLNPKAQRIVFWATLPLTWLELVIFIYGFFFLPWYTVLISCGIGFFLAPLFDSLSWTFLRPGSPSVAYTRNHLVALRNSCLILLVICIWYFGFARRL